jgi:hypothetical protein
VPEIVIMDLDLQDKVAVVTGGSKGHRAGHRPHTA